MMSTPTAEEILKGKGWKMYYECTTCRRSGPVKHWSHEDFKEYDIRTQIRSQTFSIYYRNIRIHGPDWNYLIESMLKHHGIDKV